MKTTLTLALVLLVATTVRAQDTADTRSRFGLFGGASYDIHSSSFRDLPGMQTCCMEFTSADGLGPYIGLFYRFQLSKQFKLSARIGYAQSNGSFEEDEFIGFALQGSGDNATVVEGTSQHTLNTSVSSIELVPRLEFYPIDKSGFGLHLLLNGAIQMSGDYDSKETLISPNGAVYSDTRTTERNSVENDITNLSSLRISAGIGVHWDFALGDSWWLTPELTYQYGFTDVADFSGAEPDATWKVSSLRLGIAIGFSPMPSAAVAATTPSGRKGLTVAVDARELKNDGSEAAIATVRVEETLSMQLYPLLPYVFFDDGVSNINTNSYRNLTPAQTRTFNPEKDFLFDNTAAPNRALVTMDVYKNMLNVVGKRMRDQFPNSKLTVVGCNSDQGDEKNNDQLSQQRAESVKNYLTNVWGIDAGRIAAQSRGLPEKASKYTVSDARDKQDAVEENRRVELSSDTPDVLYPVVVRDTLRELTPPRLRFRLVATSDTTITSWQLNSVHPLTPNKIKTGESFLREEGNGAPPEYVVWSRAESQKEIPKSADPVTSTFSVSDARGQSIAVRDTLPVDFVSIERKKREKIGNYEVDRFRLALFEYEETSLNALHQQIVDKFIKPSLQPGAIVEIDGYTDRKGANQLNQQLSESRANTVSNALGTTNATVRAHGEGTDSDKAPFDNASPEGRLYNRTVDVTIKVPSGG